jgi:hypothetical protein
MGSLRSLSILTVLALSLAASSGPASAQRVKPAVTKTVKPGKPGKGKPLTAAQQARRAKLTKGKTTDRATAIRLRANKMTRVLSKGKTNAHAKKYLATSYKKDMAFILGAVARMQKEGGLSPAAEQRATAAVGRVLKAAMETRPESVSSGQTDAYAVLNSRAQYRRKAPKHETAVEIETRMTDKIMASLTTKDGTVAPILRESGKSAPEFLVKMAGAKAVESIKWDALNPAQKLQLLQHASRGQSFFSNRNIPGLAFRKSIAKPVDRSVVLGGKETAKNSNSVRIDSVLLNKVEFMGPTNVEKVNGIEYHVRQTGRASRNANDAFTLGELFNSPAKSGHEHIPNRIPKEVMRGNAVDRAGLVDFYRRANVTAELKAIKDGYAIKPVRDGSVTYFDFLHGKGVASLNNHLHSMAAKGSSSLGQSDLKMGAVGFRTGELYGDKGKFGFEVRTLHKKDGNRGKFVDAVQKGILTGHYGLRRSVMQKWHKANVPKASNDNAYVQKQSSVLGALHYSRPIAQLLDGAPTSRHGMLTTKVKQQLSEHAETHYGLKMLVHDWSKDPALMGNAKAQSKVLTAQKAGLDALARGEKPGRIIASFADRSGLYEAFTKSIGMNDRAVQ